MRVSSVPDHARHRLTPTSTGSFASSTPNATRTPVRICRARASRSAVLRCKWHPVAERDLQSLGQFGILDRRRQGGPGRQQQAKPESDAEDDVRSCRQAGCGLA